MIKPFTWLNDAFLALVGESETKRQNESLLGFRVVHNDSRNGEPDNRTLFGNWLNDTVSYYH